MKPSLFIFPEYYIFAFQFLHANLLNDVPSIVRSARAKVKQRYAKEVWDGNQKLLIGDEAYSFLLKFLQTIEHEMKALLQEHSPFFWLHLYRRIGIGSVAEDGEKADASTLFSVRKTVESAILKYGNMAIEDDMCASDEISAEEVLDGLFFEVCSKANKSSVQINSIWDFYKNQWVLKKYKRGDHAVMYTLEGLAYEYWRATANMRAIGKGASLFLEHDGNWSEIRDSDLDRLILRYDRRLAGGQNYISTAKGLLSFNEKTDSLNSIVESNFLFATYNASRVPFAKISKKFAGSKNVATNFLPVLIDYRKFLDAHRILHTPFYKKWGFSLTNVFLFFAAISAYVLFSRKAHKAPDSMSLFHLLQRAYAQVSLDLDALSAELMQIIENFSLPTGLVFEVTADELLKICRHFCLSPKGQETISLWSHGPRPVIVPYAEMNLIDIGGMGDIFTNLFFGVKEDQQQRGIELEKILRDETTNRGVELLSNRILRYSENEYRETDLAIRVGNILILCDCRSAERPLDLIIGKPSTLKYRNELMEKKVDQVISIKKFIAAKPVGNNYDFSWATTVHSIGVLPDIEWIWSEDSRYWLDPALDLPILMCVQEMFDFFDRLRSTQKSQS